MNLKRRRPMSQSRQKVFQAVCEFISENGYSPSIRELSERLQLAAHSGVHFHLECLCRDGLLSRVHHKARSWYPATRCFTSGSSAKAA